MFIVIDIYLSIAYYYGVPDALEHLGTTYHFKCQPQKVDIIF